MWYTFKKIREIENSTSINKFIFILKNNRFTKNIFKNLDYGNYDVKKTFTFFALVFSFIKKLLITLFIACIGIGYPLLIIPKANFFSANCFMHMFICFYVIWGCFAKSIIFTTDKNKFVYIKLMHLDAKKYIFSQFIIKRITEVICETLVFGSWYAILGGNIINILILILTKTIFKCFGEMVQIFLYKKTGKILDRDFKLYLGFLAITVFGAYSSLSPAFTLVYNPIIILVLALTITLLGIFGLIYMIKFQDYFSIVTSVNAPKNINFSSQDIKNIRTAGLQLKNKDSVSVTNNKFKNKTGFNYFNSIFFERFKSTLLKPIKAKTIVITTLFTFCFCLGFLVPEFKEIYHDCIFKYVAIIICLLSNNSSLNKFIKVMFFNCDLPLLKYNILSNNGSIYLCFKQRLKKLLILNLIPNFITALFLLILEFSFFSEVNLDILYLSIYSLLISIISTITGLSIYYLIQPYSQALELKNNTYVYIQSYTICLIILLLQLHVLTLKTILIILSIISVISFIVFPILVKKLSFKTFKIKN